MRRFTSLLVLVLLFGMGGDLQAQSRRERRKARRQNTAQQVAPPKITVDTPAAVKSAPPPVAPPTDSVAQDSTKIEEVAQVVHDSVKAQLKAPIVQVPVTLRSLVVPGILFGYGVITLNNTDLRVINRQAQDWAWNGQKYSGFYIENYGLFAPALAVYALNICGVKGQNNLIDRSIIYGMSNLISNSIVFGVKQFGISRRPDGSDEHSFPSGHTAQAFVSAEFFHQSLS